LSVLDLVPLGEGGSSASALAASVELARAVEALGYRRLWYAEHHNMPGIATTTPEILIAHVAHVTSRIRLGAGGVMLPNHAPLKVAESYRLLEALHPGRIDLGIGRAPGTDPVTAIALRGPRHSRGADYFLEQLGDLIGFGAGTLAPQHPYRSVRAMPDDVRLPPIWLLGSTSFSAQLAARLGLGFAFAGHFSPEPPEAALRAYRQDFRSGALPQPHAILALSVFCAETEALAQRLASSALVSIAELLAGRPGRLPHPDVALAYQFSPEEEIAVSSFRRVQIVGTPDQVRARVEDAVRLTSADEVMIATHAFEPLARQRSYELVAQAFG
jgi:luciferase family oxidoreductase group 1